MIKLKESIANSEKKVHYILKKVKSIIFYRK